MSSTESLSVLFIAAHADDTELSSGGTIAKWVKAGHAVRYVVCTNGDKGTHDRNLSPYRLAEMREAEQRAAATLMGVDQVIFLRHPDGELQPTLAFRTELAILIRHFRAQVIFTHDPWRPYQIHPDHRNVGLTACDAIVSARDHLFLPALEAIGLEPFAPSELYLWGSEQSDYYEDISATIDLKIEAVGEHKSQIPQIGDWAARIRSWGEEVGQKAGMRYAEGFKRVVFRPASHVFPAQSPRQVGAENNLDPPSLEPAVEKIDPPARRM